MQVRAQKPERSGYALIVVLSSLAVLTVLFAASSARTVARLEFERAETSLATEIQENAAIAEAVLNQSQFEPNVEYQYSTGGQTVNVIIQPTGGLVDLNAGKPELIRALISGYQLSEVVSDQIVDRVLDARQHGNQMSRVSDIERVADIDTTLLPDLDLLATVFSGRDGIALRQAPDRLLHHLSRDETASRAALESAFPVQFVSPPNGSNFVILKKVAGKWNTIANIRYGASQADRAILSLQ